MELEMATRSIRGEIGLDGLIHTAYPAGGTEVLVHMKTGDRQSVGQRNSSTSHGTRAAHHRHLEPHMERHSLEHCILAAETMVDAGEAIIPGIMSVENLKRHGIREAIGKNLSTRRKEQQFPGEGY